MSAEPISVTSQAARVRLAVALSCTRLGQPAMNLLARSLVALAEPMDGVACHLAGFHSPDQWREMLRGERTLPLYDICRLATEPGKEARQAVVALLQELAAAVGHHVMPLERRDQDALRCIADSAEQAGELSSTAIEAARDGKLDESERRSLKDQINGQIAVLTLAKGAL